MTKEETIRTMADYVHRGVQSLESALAEAYEQGQLATRWISVEDELPERDEDVLILTPQNQVHIAAYKYRNWQTKAHVFASGIDGYRWNNVTHWQHLPLPPAKLSSLERNGKNWKEKKGGEQ